MDYNDIPFYEYNTIIVGTGASGLNAALALKQLGQSHIALVTEGLMMGTSRNTGSDKQTYYKLMTDGPEPDSVSQMARTLFDGGCMDGDLALCEAAGSLRAFFRLVEMGVPFPHNSCGEYIGYKTDHDPVMRGTSAGPLTSRYMTECLEKAVKEEAIPIYDGYQAVRLLVKENGSDRRACGILALNKKKCRDEAQRYAVFSADNVIWATGGEAGMYEASVYPPSQTGGLGVLLREGVKAKNLTESQFGIASVKFRWNLSGTFQQCIPRYVSTDANGEDEREFLEPYFDSPGKLVNAIFLKGYQWPFDPRKAFEQGSSLIDLLVYQETVLSGRRVFLDYMHNPSALQKNGAVDFTYLTGDGKVYLENCQALLETPYKRLEKMNPKAIEVYSSHHIDLSREYLEIQVSAQHNNGGIAANKWWETSLSHLFAVGEANGSHGIYRPGGSALNSGQVGSMRAAQFIVHNYREEPLGREAFLEACKEALEEEMRFAEEALSKTDGLNLEIAEERRKLQHRMTQYGACIRSEKGLERAIEENRKQAAYFRDHHKIADPAELGRLYQLRQLLLSQYVYLAAMLDYSRTVGISRGSYLVYNPQGRLPDERLNELFRNITKETDTSVLQEISYDADSGSCRPHWRAVRPIPKNDIWFENVWQNFRKDGIFK
ncbi:FAD-dependent oxidoreductase [Lacrimispora sp. 210928-DFI.3.58]|uniref:FAD-binding protein n=1 Tax=Lacrimispora sp. 210928-DFI.3.58 TaxID=2883214 RepID=UPI001D06A10E|nr:FAD-binding protein [Lacrimispora sp. 210928-DFI.3.58]MCB7317496.1 FAD-binding protein [Lacrimispora sp. 210928-DFI.3.58]